VKVYDWNGSAWTQVGNTLTGTATGDEFGRRLAISGDGNIIAVAARAEHTATYTDAGVVRVYYLDGSTWTILPDSGTETETETGYVDTFVGISDQQYLGGGGVKLSYDGKTLLIGDRGNDTGGTNRGQVRVYTYSDGAWSQKGLALSGTVDSQNFGAGVDMSEDGNHLIIGTGGSSSQVVQVYAWDGTVWSQKGSDITYSGGDDFGQPVSISNDGNVIALGIPNADLADGALADDGGIVRMYHYTESNWELNTTLVNETTGDDNFGADVQLSGDGNRLIVSAPDDNSYRGKLHTFEYTGTSWKKKEPIDNFSATGLNPSDRLGYGAAGTDQGVTLSRDGSTIVGGELGHDTGSLSNAGRARVWNMPSNIKSIWGSNDDVNWTKIVSGPTREEATSNVAGLAFGYDDRLEFKNLDNPNYYKYHAIVADAFTRLKDVKLFGVRKQGSSTLHDGALTLTKNLDVPRIGPPPDVDDTPRRDRLVVEYNTSTNPMEDGVVRDTSGRGNDGVFYGGASYDASAKALVFDGTGDYLEGPVHNSSGEWLHSVSMWFKRNASDSYDVLFHLGQQSAGKTSSMRLFSDNRFRFNFYDGDIEASYTVNNGIWYHLAFSYSGGTDIANRKIYLNGVELTVTNVSGTPVVLNLDANEMFTLATQRAIIEGQMNCDISNFKLYDTVLTAQEVKTLYDMGRCDEGGHVVNFSKTRVGIGLGDGEAPRAALDVRGDINVQGTITTFTHPYGPSYSLTTISPDIWAIAGESTARIGGGAISYTSGVSIKYHNGVPMWFFGSRDESVDILNTINHTTNTWSVAIAIAKKPESQGTLFNQITNSETNTDTNHRIYWAGSISGDEFRPSGNGWNTGASNATTAIPDESVIYVKKTGTGTGEVYAYVNGGLIGQATSNETFSGSTPNKIRLGRRTRFTNYSPETPLYMGIAAIAVWDSAIDNADIAKYITYQSLTAR
jgi:hypothetical protein